MYTVLYSVHSTSEKLEKSLFWTVLVIIPYVLTCLSCVIWSRLAPGNIFKTVPYNFLLAVPVCGAILGTECPIIWAKECR
jgi:hypothetical protein